MFPFGLDNALADNWMSFAVINSTTTLTAVDLANAIGPVGLSLKVPASGSGTLSVQPVMSLDNIPFINVPADAILNKTTGLATTFTNVTSAGSQQTVYLKRDQLYRYVSVLFTPVVAGSLTINLVELH